MYPYRLFNLSSNGVRDVLLCTMLYKKGGSDSIPIFICVLYPKKKGDF